jgi:hypothetical protein
LRSPVTPVNLPAGIELPSGFPPDPALIDALCAETEPAEKQKRLKQLRLQAKKGRAWVTEQADNLEQIYTEIARSDADAEHLVRLAQIVLEKWHSAAERLMPGIEELRRKLAVRGARLGPEMQPFQESVDIAVDWLALYDGLHTRLLKLAASRRTDVCGILHARPVEGEVDDEALTREIIARFPKILAALAE